MLKPMMNLFNMMIIYNLIKNFINISRMRFLILVACQKLCLLLNNLYLFTHLSIYLFIYLFVFFFLILYLFICLFICLFIYLFNYLFISPLNVQNVKILLPTFDKYHCIMSNYIKSPIITVQLYIKF